MSTTKIHKNTTAYMHILIMICLTFGVGLLPPFGQITEVGMRVLGVFLGLLYGWIFIDLLWPSLFGFLALGLTDYTTMSSALSAGFGHPTLLLTLIVSVFAEGLNRIGVNKAIAYWLLSRKYFIGKPWLLIVGLCSVAVIMGVAGGGFAAIFLLWNVVFNMAEINGYPKGHRLVNMLIAFILYGVMTGGSIVPFQGGVILYGGFFTQSTGLGIQSAPFLTLGLLYIFVTLFCMILLSKVVFKIDASHFTTTAELCEEYAQQPVNKYQKAGLILLAVYFLGLLLPEIFTTIPFMQFLKSLGVLGFSLIYIFIFAAWKDENGEPVLNVMEAFRNGVPWPVLVLLAVTFPLAAAMESAEVGIMVTVNTFLTPILTELGVAALIIIATITIGVLTQFLHNVVMGALFIPFLAPLVINLGGNPHTLFFMLYLVLCCAYATPAGSMMAGLIFGHKDVPTKDAYLFGWMFLAVSIVILICLMPLCNMLFKF